MIDFLKYKYICYALSFALLAVGGVAYVTKGFQYYVDFAGGSELRVSFQKPVKIGEIRKVLGGIDLKDAVIQSLGTEEKIFLIQIGKTTEENVGQIAFDKIAQQFPENKAKLESIDWVGPEVGKDIKFNAVISILLSLLLIMLYIAIRSKYRFAVGAGVAIAHDMLAVLACFLILGEQISVHVLAAILTVLGYSINDTIVIFSRIKDNMIKMKDATEEHIVNVSLNQTLRRTMLTSISTFLAVGSIFVLGGEALHGFSLAMLIGIVVGTYSSIYIASPVMLLFKSPQASRLPKTNI